MLDLHPKLIGGALRTATTSIVLAAAFMGCAAASSPSDQPTSALPVAETPQPSQTVGPSHRPQPTTAVSEPLPQGIFGAWYDKGPAYMTFMPAGNPYCVTNVRTTLDCAVWQGSGRPNQNAIATFAGNVLSLRFKAGHCNGTTSLYTMALNGDSLVLTEHPGGCNGGNLFLVRAGTGGTSTPPPLS